MKLIYTKAIDENTNLVLIECNNYEFSGLRNTTEYVELPDVDHLPASPDTIPRSIEAMQEYARKLKMKGRADIDVSPKKRPSSPLHHRSNKQWTTQEVKLLKRLDSDNVTMDEKEIRLGRSASSIWNKMNELNLHVRRQRAWCEAEDEHLVKLHVDGWNNADVAEIMDRTENAIHTRLSKLKKVSKYEEAFIKAGSLKEEILNEMRDKVKTQNVKE